MHVRRLLISLLNSLTSNEIQPNEDDFLLLNSIVLYSNDQSLKYECWVKSSRLKCWILDFDSLEVIISYLSEGSFQSNIVATKSLCMQPFERNSYFRETEDAKKCLIIKKRNPDVRSYDLLIIFFDVAIRNAFVPVIMSKWKSFISKKGKKCTLWICVKSWFTTIKWPFKIFFLCFISALHFSLALLAGSVILEERCVSFVCVLMALAFVLLAI